MSESITVRDGLSIVLHEELPNREKDVRKAEHTITQEGKGCSIVREKDKETNIITITIEKDAQLDKPIIMSSHYNCFGKTRIYVVAKEGSSASLNRFILELRQDRKKGFIEEEIEIHVEKGALFRYNERVDLSSHSIWKSSKKTQDKGTLQLYNHLEEGKLLLQDITTTLTSKNSEVQVLHTALITGAASTKIETTHSVAETTSSMKSRNVVQGQMINSGLIHITEKAQNSSGEQHSNTLLVGEGVANTHPQLEIDNAEVSCSHGSTTGHIEEEALLYLQSRGLSKEKAQEMIVAGHLDSITESTDDKEWKADILSLLHARKQDIICLKCSLSRIDSQQEVQCRCN